MRSRRPTATTTRSSRRITGSGSAGRCGRRRSRRSGSRCRGGGPRLRPAADICAGRACSDLAPGGETAGRRRLGSRLSRDADGYADHGDDLAADATSRLSPYLHFGCLSPVEVVARAGRRDSAGARAFVRQVAWRDFYHQVLAARPATSVADYRPRRDRWRRDDEAFAAWRDGRTGYPIVDAGMRQLAAEGWMHNRARLIVGSFLTKTLYLDWRLGAQHFLDLLVDGDVVNNQMNWQWVARHAPLVDLTEATERFRAARGH